MEIKEKPWINLSDTPLITQEGDDLFLISKDKETHLQFEIRNISYIGNDLNCKLTCLPSEVGKHYIPYITRVNLLSHSAREALTRSLKNTFRESAVNWDLRINQMSAMVEQFLNKPKEIFDLTTTTHENTSYLLYPFIAENQANMIFGKGGTGKTYISLALATALASGEPFLESVPSKKVKVLFIDYESTKGIFAKRLQKVSPNFKENNMLLYRPTHEPLFEIVDELRGLVRNHGIELIIVDSVALACGGRPEEAEMALKFFLALKRIPCTSLAIAHETKAENKSYAFGSVFFFNSFRNIWNAQSEPDDLGSSVLNVGLFHRKANEDKISYPRGIRIYFGEETIEISAGNTGLWEKEQTVNQQIWTLLLEGAKTNKEIADHLGKNRETIRKELHRMNTKGKVEQNGDFWKLSDGYNKGDEE